MSPWNFSGVFHKHVAGVEHYPELLKQINVARDQLDKAARRACETLGRRRLLSLLTLMLTSGTSYLK